MLKKNFLSLFAAVIILYLSLASSKNFDRVPLINIPHIDKIVHFLMYFGLMSVIAFENKKSIRSPRKLMLIAIIPLLYGILMEILQASFTVSRSGSIFDAVFDFAGIFVAVVLLLYIKPFRTGVTI